jgi:transposase-like protein
MHHIPDERKQAILIKMLSPDAPSIANMAKQEGISEATLYNWRTKLRQQGRPVPTPDRNSTNWTAQTKFAIIVETASMNEAELADYCRGKGLYPEQVKAWRDIAVSAQNGHQAGQTEQQKITQSHLKKIKELQREVDRKNKALAEAAALLVLQKKLRALWDEGEDE